MSLISFKFILCSSMIKKVAKYYMNCRFFTDFESVFCANLLSSAFRQDFVSVKMNAGLDSVECKRHRVSTWRFIRLVPDSKNERELKNRPITLNGLSALIFLTINQQLITMK